MMVLAYLSCPLSGKLFKGVILLDISEKRGSGRLTVSPTNSERSFLDSARVTYLTKVAPFSLFWTPPGFFLDSARLAARPTAPSPPAAVPARHSVESSQPPRTKPFSKPRNHEGDRSHPGACGFCHNSGYDDRQCGNTLKYIYRTQDNLF